MNHPYYKKIDRSLLEGWVIIIKEYGDDFLHGESITPGTSRDVKIKYKIKNLKKRVPNIVDDPFFKIRFDLSQCTFDCYLFVAFDDIAYFQVMEIGNAQSAFVTG